MIDANLYGTGIDDNFFDTSLDLFFQELEIVFQLRIDDIYAYPIVLNLRKYVYSKKVSNAEVQQEITDYVKENCEHSSYFQWNVTVDFIKSTETVTDVMYIKFDIYTNGGVRKRQFIISE